MEELTKEEKDQYIRDMIKNLIHDQTAFNINRWGSMSNYHEMWGLALEESEEAKEQLAWVTRYKEDTWKMIKNNEPIGDIHYSLQVIIGNIELAIQELIHEPAVYKRALDTMKNAPVADQSKTDADKK